MKSSQRRNGRVKKTQDRSARLNCNDGYLQVPRFMSDTVYFEGCTAVSQANCALSLTRTLEMPQSHKQGCLMSRLTCGSPNRSLSWRCADIQTTAGLVGY